MPADVFTRDGVEIRRLKSGRCVLEDEWQQYIEINKVLRVPYMLENEPFAKLPIPYRPCPKFDHRPPVLRLGFAIPNHVAEFRRAALKCNLGDPEELRTTKKYSFLRLLVRDHLNERCGLSPEEGIAYDHIDSKVSDLVLQIATNYGIQIPEDKVDDALCAIRDIFSLPDDAHPKWYLEAGIIDKDPDPDQYQLPMSVFKWSKSYWD